MAQAAIRFQNLEFGSPRDVVVNPALVSSVGQNNHGVTYLQTSAGRVLVQETPEEVIALLGWELPADLTPVVVAPMPFTFDANGQVNLSYKKITALEMTSADKSIVYVFDKDYSVDAEAGEVSIIPVPPPAVKPAPGTPPVDPPLKPGQVVLIGFSYLKPPPTPVAKATLLKATPALVPPKPITPSLPLKPGVTGSIASPFMAPPAVTPAPKPEPAFVPSEDKE